MDQLEQLAADMAAIKERNRRVELDKAWERSGFRIFSILIITYLIATAVMWKIGIQHYFLNALIPTIGYFLSTQSLPIIKRWWISRFYSKDE